MPVWIADYLGDTRQLSLAEHGAYLLLMFEYWRTGEALPDSPPILARICSATVTEWETVSVAVRAKFKPAIINGRHVLTHKRIETELTNMRSQYDRRVAASARANQAKAEAAARLKQLKSAKSVTAAATVTVTDTVSVSVAETDTQLKTHNSSSLHEEEEMDSSDFQSDPPKLKSSPKGTRKTARAVYPSEFEQFWKAYPTDQIMSKKAAAVQWNKLTPDDQIAAGAAVPGFRAFCAKDKTYRPVHAERFLRERRFDGFKPANIIDAETALASKDKADRMLRRGKYAPDADEDAA